MPRDKRTQKREFKFNGRLITSDDPASIAENYQELKNLRYEGEHLRGVGGMSKINSSVINATYPKTRKAIHFRKEQPQESHVVVEAFNSGESASRILENTTAIPNTGNFSSTALYTPTGSSAGNFSTTPAGGMAYCNGEDVCVWGGTEYEVGAFLNYDPDESFSYDYTKQVRNTASDAKNKAVFHSASAGIDADTLMLLHLDNNDNDEVGTHTGITPTGMTYDSGDYVFGTHSAVFNESTSKLVVPDHSDFDFSDGTHAIDLRLKVDDLDNDHSFFYQQSDSERFRNCYVNTSGGITIDITNDPSTSWAATTAYTLGDAVIPTTPNNYFYECTTAGTSAGTEPAGWPTTVGDTQVDGSVTWTCRAVVDEELTSLTGVVSAGTWYHVEVAENSGTWYIFVDGILKGGGEVDDGCIDYSGDVQIGYDNSAYFDGKMDEYRVSAVARHTADFEIPASQYSATAQTYLYIGSTMPLKGFKPYIQTANTATNTSSVVYYWNGTTWTLATTVVDGTASGGISFAQTGSFTFDTTAGSAKVSYIDGMTLFWYRIIITETSSTAAISYLTLDTDFYTIQNIWDGVRREIISFQHWDTVRFDDYTFNVRDENYLTNDTATYANMAATTGAYFVAGFYERMMGIRIQIVPDHPNSSGGSYITVYYWNGGSWVECDNINDGTTNGTSTLAQSGVITWEPPNEENEFKQSINNEEQLYYYKIQCNTIISAPWADYITGIPSPDSLGHYRYPLLAHNRLWLLCNEKERKNSAICSSEGTIVAFNGQDSDEFEFGDNTELTGGALLYSQYGSSLYNVVMFFKKAETWALVGNDPESWVKYRMSGTVGCVAPDTLKVVDVEPKDIKNSNRTVAVWQGANGIYISDGKAPIKISDDIKDIFDKRSSTAINPDEIANSTAFWDSDKQEYHWLYADSTNTDLNKEMVFSFRKGGWFEIVRPATMKLQTGVEVIDTGGNTYQYGFIDTGYMERLENGNDFDGTAIDHTVHTGDIAIDEGSIMTEVDTTHTALVSIAKSTTSNNITGTHYVESKTSGDSFTMSPQKSGYRLVFDVDHKGQKKGVFHSWKFAISTDDETIGFEPLYFGVLYTKERDKTRDWRS